jgi:SAM-dependent methyltransferase
MSDDYELAFTGERLHAGSRLFGVDLARHRAAYAFAAERAGGQRVLDLGCGTGYGAAELAEQAAQLVAVDRVQPAPQSRRSPARFLRADIAGLPLVAESFDLIVSFQVIEHLEGPTLDAYLHAVAQLVRPGGTVLVSTPNILTSDRVNPFHVHEYEADELADCLREHFDAVTMHGVGMSPAVREWMDARLARIRKIMRLDVLGLRDRLPRPVIEWAFGTLAKVVRRGIQQDQGGDAPEVSERDFPIGDADNECIDLLAVCRRAD